MIAISMRLAMLGCTGAHRLAVAAACALVLLGLTGAGGQAPPPRPLTPLPGAHGLMLRVGVERFVGLKATAVPLGTAFESGDRFCLTLTTNHPGYIALLVRGAGGKLEPSWPSTGGTVPIAADETIVVPPEGSLRFDETAGIEMIRVAFSLARFAATSAPRLDAEVPPGTMKQIRLRGLVADPGSQPADMASYYTGELVEGGIFVVDLALAHRARK